MVASTDGEQKILPELSIPALAADYFQPNGEEGVNYYESTSIMQNIITTRQSKRML